MPKVENGWVMFSGNYGCRADDIAYVYATDSGGARVSLRYGGSFYVQDSYASVMRVLAVP